MAESDKKSVSELRVVDLKYELEKRKIDTTGNKAVLVKKLHKALTNEGLDPEKHLFDIEVDSRGSPMRKKKPLDEPDVKKEVDDSMKEDIKNEEAEAKETVNNKKKEEGKIEVNDSVNQSGESKPENNSSHENTPTEINDDKEDEKVTIKKEDEDEKNKPVDTISKSTKSEDKDSDKEAAIKTEMIEVNEENDESKTDLKSEVVEDSKNGTAALESVKDEFKKEVEPKIDLAEAARVKKEEEEEVDELEELLDDKEEDEVEENGNKDADDEDVLKLEDKSDVNGMDAEDSIHLMIGEDEEKLMAGEDDPVEKRKDVKEDRSRRGGKGQDARKNDGRSISPDNSAEEKGKKSNYRNLWVSNLASMTRAQDLKQIFSKLGKVVAAKVVTNAKTPGARCYGFVTMATADDAQACIKGLNMTELHGRLISVEAVASKPASANPGKKPEEKGKPVETTQSSDRKRRREDSEGKVNEPMGENEEKKGDTSDKASIGGDDISLKKEEEEKEEGKEGEESDKGGHSGSSPPRRSRPHVRERLGERPVATARRTNNRERIAIRTGRQDVLSFAKIKEERERQRLREKERAQREDERRRRDEMDRQRIIERRQKEELIRLEREREKVRVERLKLQKEKEEFLRLERERLAREREDLKRAQLKLEEEKRAKRAARELYEERSKRTIETSRRYDHSGPPPRKEPRRESPPSPPPTTRARYVEPRSGSRGRRIEPPPPRVKDSVRYPERSGPPSSGAAFRPSRDDRRDRERERDREDHHRKAESSRVHREERYEVPPPKGDMRYGSESWVGSSSKPYSSSGGSNSRPDNGSWMVPERKSDPHPWARNQPSQSERWAGPGGNSLPGASSRSAMYGGIGMSIGGSLGLGNVVPNMYPPADRYDAYKTSSGSMGRKY